MTETQEPILIKRYASRRLYNTETSDYVTLDEVADFIREGKDIKIVDRKSGEDITRQYLLQIIAEHESRGENVLPIDVLTDLVRSYTNQAQSVVPQFLAASFEMLRDSQSKMMENFGSIPNPMASMPGFEALREQQEAFMKAMTSGWGGVPKEDPKAEPSEDLGAIKVQHPPAAHDHADFLRPFLGRAGVREPDQLRLLGGQLVFVLLLAKYVFIFFHFDN